MNRNEWCIDTSTNEIFQIVSKKDFEKSKKSTMKLWQPQPGEWCWFSTHLNYVMEEYSHINENSTYRYVTKSGAGYKNCEPFIGKLPTFLIKS